jgi:hypothetical protein
MRIRIRLATPALLLLTALAAACGGTGDDPGDDVVGDDVPGDDEPPPPTSLARCADPAMPIGEAWEVDNIRAPLTELTAIDRTLLLSSEDGAVKTWILPEGGTDGAPTTPHYGTPFVDDGAVMPALAAAGEGSDRAFAGLDVNGRAHVWTTAGQSAMEQLDLVTAPGSFVALDGERRWIAGGADLLSGGGFVADLATREVTGPLETLMWNTAAAAFTGDGMLVTVGHNYGCPAIELRDPADPAEAVAYWDGCHWEGEMLNTGWLRAVAVSPDGREAVAVGDGLYARFSLDPTALAAGPTAYVLGETQYSHVAWSAGDDLAFALGLESAAESTIDVWSTATDTLARGTIVPAAVGIALDPASAVLVTARGDGMVRGDRCGP